MILTIILWSVIGAANGSFQRSVPPDTLITLRRSNCFFTCPDYLVTITADGKVVFEGYANVKVKGRAETTISIEKVRALIQAFEKAKFFTLRDSYSEPEDGCRIHDGVSGNPKRDGVASLTEFSFPFKFGFTYETLFSSLQKLGNFRADNVTDSGSTIWFDDKFKLLVFIPVNDSPYATKVSAELRKRDDFASVMEFETSLLYFRPLPYEFNFTKFRANTLLLYIN